MEPFKEDVARWANESEDVASIQATRSEELGRYYNKLPEFLAELEPTLAELEATAERADPHAAAAAVRGAGPPALPGGGAAVRAQHAQGARAARASCPTPGRSAIGESQPRRSPSCARLARFAPRLGKPLRQFLQALDDRARSTENDPAGGARWRPPRRTRRPTSAGQGFTGMEGLMNYFYFQTLAINATDELGHLLRIVLIAGGPCAATPPAPPRRRSRSATPGSGPNQPGVNAPEPARLPPPATSSQQHGRRAARPRAPALATGEPEAPPTPGERDISKPQVTLPDGVRKLLDDLRGPEGPPRPRRRRSAPDSTERARLRPPRLPPRAMRRQSRQSLVASPVLVGAVTVLTAIIAVFLAYNANAGLPFVPTYDLKAEIPGGSNLVKGNEVRMGGFRVGVVERILPGVAEPGERAKGQQVEQRAISVIELKLDKRVEPLSKDVRVQIRPRSALGLKYVTITPGRDSEKLDAGRHDPARPVDEADRDR